MWSSARSARRSTSGSLRSAASAWSIASIAISISPSRPRDWIGDAVKALAPPDAAAAAVIEVDFGAKPAAAPSTDIVEAEITEHIDLNSSRSDKETIHLALAFEARRAGLRAGRLARSLSPRTIRPMSTSCSRRPALRLTTALRTEFIKTRDITTLSLKTVETYADATGHQYVKALIDDGQVKNWIAGRQLIDLIATFPIALDAETLRALTRPLAPRAYSIASSRREVGDEAHLLISAVRYESHGRARKGVASNYVAERLKTRRPRAGQGEAEPAFRLPAPDKDIIMVGPGTGVAPFRAFVQERRATEATGKSWLFFGDRTFTHDFLYQLEWQDALKDGALTRMDVAFSRDTPEKVYVQHQIWERRARAGRVARQRRLFLRLRRCQGDGEGRARGTGARLCRREGIVARGRRTGGGDTRARQALSAGHLLILPRLDASMTDDRSRNERIKEASDYLRGTLAEGLREEITGAIIEDDQQLVKFHGMYLQDDRDLRAERTRKKMEKAFAFMIRVRISGRRADAAAMAQRSTRWRATTPTAPCA